MVTLPDVAPTVLAHFDLNLPSAMNGRPWRSVGGPGPPAQGIEAAVELVLDRDDKLAYARLMGMFAQVGEAALVDRFLRLDDFVEVAQRTGVTRILVRPDPGTEASLAIAIKTLPILLCATQFLLQKMSPMPSPDPAQQKMMMIMPLMLSVMFLWAPSGLVVYWFVSNLWAIGQQYFTNWLLGPMPVHVVRPAAERRLKSAGAGRTERAEKRS